MIKNISVCAQNLIKAVPRARKRTRSGGESPRRSHRPKVDQRSTDWDVREEWYIPTLGLRRFRSVWEPKATMRHDSGVRLPLAHDLGSVLFSGTYLKIFESKKKR